MATTRLRSVTRHDSTLSAEADVANTPAAHRNMCYLVCISRKKRGMARLMNDTEWERFWSKWEGRPRLMDDTEWERFCSKCDRRPRRAGRRMHIGHKPRTTAAVCHLHVGADHCARSADCGRCRNCSDKPKSNGPGLRKKACVLQRCVLHGGCFAHDGKSDSVPNLSTRVHLVQHGSHSAQTCSTSNLRKCDAVQQPSDVEFSQTCVWNANPVSP